MRRGDDVKKRRWGMWCTASVLAVLALISCGNEGPVLPGDGLLPIGTYGADNAGVIVTDSTTHVHVDCTFGDVTGRIHLDGEGAFEVAGSYVLRAYPVMVGPSLPARFAGRFDGRVLTMSIVVDDTVAHETVTKGPITVKLGVNPRMGPCPICADPAGMR